ncbi:MAG TPA: hypothetical protein VF657_11345, partial [Actinoplanes sp.]
MLDGAGQVAQVCGRDPPAGRVGVLVQGPATPPGFRRAQRTRATANPSQPLAPTVCSAVASRRGSAA